MRNILFRSFVLMGLLSLLGVTLLSQSWKRREIQNNLGRGGSADPDVVGTFPGDPIEGINVEEFELFRIGLEDFLEVEDAAEHLVLSATRWEALEEPGWSLQSGLDAAWKMEVSKLFRVEPDSRCSRFPPIAPSHRSR